jgi:CBS domain-containing protein
MQVKDMMTRGVECIGPEASLQEAAARMKELNVGPLPVCENDRLVGMITDRDITIRCTADGGHPSKSRVRDAMTPDVVFCFEDQDIAEAADTMRTRQIRRLVVLDRNKRMVGIVSLGDLATEARDDHLSGETLESISQPGEADVKRLNE